MAQVATRGIANKGFSDLRKAVARINYFNVRLGRRPLSLTGHTSNVVGHLKKEKNVE
jgi:hypothetical protein